MFCPVRCKNVVHLKQEGAQNVNHKYLKIVLSYSEPTLVTHIWLVVRVPVLSEQITEVQPRVSTDGRLLTMAFFLAMRRVPRARQVVMTAGKPGKKREMKRY